ncbi:MAG: MetQ/NlpA family ABC transporter substrate-binding protein [Peptoniphilus sp.]|nr:MetQ/NlpA family ABC transporter substrate-binding protein [Peptoniphilus sp.]
MKKILILLTLSLLLVGCAGGNNKKEEAVNPAEDNKIVIGVTPVPHEEIIKAFEQQFKDAGLEVEIVVFDDYIQPNEQLAAGDLDANFFQHKPYLDEFAAQNKLDLVSIGGVHIEPMAVYSDKLSSLDELQEKDEIIIPNDPTNGGRALIMLDKEGIIKLEDNTNLSSTENDIAENPKNLTFVPMDAQNIPNTYKDAAAAIINSNFAIGAGLSPTEDSLLIEPKDSPYANIVVVRTGEEEKEKFKKFMEILNSDDVKEFIEEKYQGAIIPAF